MRAIILLAIIGIALAAVPNNPVFENVLSKTSPRIVGGDPTTVDQYPYIVNMQYLFFISWFQRCGGSLITSTTVLSAAHCFVGDSPSQWRARVGTSFASTGGQVINAASLILHETYNNPQLDNDVAIIRLASPAVFSASVQPVRIAGTNYNVPDNTLLTTIGWGTLWSGGPSPEQLHAVNLYAINHQICTERYAYLKTLPGYSGWPDVTNNMICAGYLDVGGRDACQGDSGGPLVHQGDILVGVVSWGFGCADVFYPGVNARVSALSNWIVQYGSEN